jgi:hypothetical protein
MCIAAVEKEPFAIRYVKDQTRELCLLAVSRSYATFKHIKEPTEEMRRAAERRREWEAVKKDGMMIQYIEEQTPELCLAAVRIGQNVQNLNYAWQPLRRTGI